MSDRYYLLVESQEEKFLSIGLFHNSRPAPANRFRRNILTNPIHFLNEFAPLLLGFFGRRGWGLRAAHSLNKNDTQERVSFSCCMVTRAPHRSASILETRQ